MSNDTLFFIFYWHSYCNKHVGTYKKPEKGVKMKLVLLSLLTVLAISAEAAKLSDLLPILVGNGLTPGRPAPYPGDPYRPPGRPPHPPRPPGGNPYPGQPYPGNPYPGYGVTCRADDRGHEEHWGGHYSCGECLQRHGECIETCSSATTECRVEGRDRYGSVISFLGRGQDRWSAESEAIRACQYNYATNCYVVSCEDRQEVVSRRSCR